MSSTLDRAKRRKVIVGGSHLDFIRWCRENDVSPMSVIRPTFWEALLGLELKEEDIVRIGPMSSKMEEVLRTRIR